MVLAIEAIKASNAPSLREAITAYFREEIRRGHLPPGSTIPATRELAALLGTSSPNIHHALTPLVKEGLITRDRKRGTIVAERPHELTCIAVYLYYWSLEILPTFQHALIAAFRQQLEARHIECRLVVDNLQQHGLQQIRHWAERGEIQGVIMPFAGVDTKSINAISRMPVPAVFHMEPNWAELSRQVVAGFRAQGSRRIGVVGSHRRLEGNPPHENAFYGYLRREAQTQGLELCPDWLQVVEDETGHLRTPDAKTRFAYERCGRLLDLPATVRPDGLFVFWDDLITGALLAILQRRLEAPRDLKLVVYRNWELDVVALPPCAMVGLSVATMAGKFIESLASQFHGQPPTDLNMDYELRIVPAPNPQESSP